MSVAWGILSTAAINDRILPGLRESDAIDIRAVASRDEATAVAYARERGIQRAYGSYEALLADPDVEAVYVPLPNSLHAEWTLRALEAGKHVLCEKPFTPRAADVERVFEVARRAGLLVMEGFMYRHNPQTLKLGELVREGAVGDVQLIRSSFRFAMHDPDDIRLSTELEGGSLMDLGSYCVNISRFLAGEPEEVVAEQVIGPTGVDVRFMAVLRFADEVVAQFDDAVSLPLRAEIEVAGSEGSLLVEDPWLCGRPGITLQRGDELERIDVEPANSYRLEFENLGAAIRGDAEPRLGYEDALGQARTIEALFRSVREGARVRVDAA
jgi:xylose dehydrogenase (NAD/NADP)